ncbi:mitochondrial large subunit ribosomal protein-domain-containing protein [Crucibulum laeve]|uniref:Large ribosomal subunit protein mL49 n=1 Tax=Crucibulum laeve TaxID=68775 RepID=A0A5C3MC20_9AGAR|nr:mitochondrial large subunit ribosomal protein-domain-containing protein [Crucibulum laeve]
MLKSLSHSMLPRICRSTRLFSQASVTLPHPTEAPQSKKRTPTKAFQHSYFVPRNTRGNLPVYTDIRNGGTRYLVTIRNVDGSVATLARDMAKSLFPKDSEDASRLNIEVVRATGLIISGGRWRNQVVEWLRQKGF